MKDCIVKSGSILDLKGIVELDKVVFQLHRTPKEIEGKLRLQKDVHFTIATKTDGKLVGYGVGYEEKKKYYLWSLAVLSEYRRKGIGSAILKEQIKFARKRGMVLSLLRLLPDGKKCSDCCSRKGLILLDSKSMSGKKAL